MKSPEKHLETICNFKEAAKEPISLQYMMIKLFVWDFGGEGELLVTS